MKVRFSLVTFFTALLLVSANFANAQSSSTAAPIAKGNNLRCAGYIQDAPVNTRYEIVGGEQEQEQNVYAEGDYVYLNFGANAGAVENARYTVTRPRGHVRSVFSRKGDLGIYVQEVASLRIVRVKSETSVALIDYSCDNVLLGDLLVPEQQRFAPQARQFQPLDRFRDPNGKVNGRIVLARDGQETLARDQVVYIDLGVEDGVKVGDYLTIWRRVGTPKVAQRESQQEIVRPEDMGFESDAFRGGKFSNQAPRKKGENARGAIASTKDVKRRRPEMPRKIVGEVVVLNVTGRTATVLITQNAQEIHTGDYVELQ
ncbi:MAG: hypothetical protein M3209_18490 [Acidobacteriota bacterium]|nr:hypothetical protein [Acidobacteriota bacterium]